MTILYMHNLKKAFDLTFSVCNTYIMVYFGRFPTIVNEASN